MSQTNLVSLRGSVGLAILGAATAFLAPLWLGEADLVAQEAQSGGLDFSVVYQHSTSGRDAMGLGARAMAADRFPGTVVGRFGELAGHIAVDFEGEILTWSARFVLGVGIATDYFSIFLASGIVGDAYQSIDEAADEEDVPPGAGIPATLGLWIRPIPELYFYGMMETDFVILVEEREVETFEPFGFGEEFRLRGGLGFEFDGVHYRVDYQWHDVAPVGWHTVTIGVGPEAPALPDL